MEAQPLHARTALSHRINEIEQQLLVMGSRADDMIGRAVESLIRLDHDLAREVLLLDDEIDELDVSIEEACLTVLALQQPIASDLREIGALMKIIADVERIGDLSVDIAKVGMKIDSELGHSDFVDVFPMANHCRLMFRDALSAFVKRDIDLVRSVIFHDDTVDDLYRDLRNQIHDHMRNAPEQVVASSWMLLAVHHLERIADHAVNIAERVAFMVTGKFEQLAPSHMSSND